MINEPYLEAAGSTTYEMGACYNVSVECQVRARIYQLWLASDVDIISNMSGRLSISSPLKTS